MLRPDVTKITSDGPEAVCDGGTKIIQGGTTIWPDGITSRRPHYADRYVSLWLWFGVRPDWSAARFLREA